MFVSILMVRILIDECSRRGIDTELLLQGTDITSAQLADSRTRFPGEQFEQLALRALKLSGDEAMGLSLGAQLPQQALQVIGYLLASAPTLRQAYGDFERYAAVLAESPNWTMREQADRAHFELRAHVPHPSTQRMAIDWSLSLAYRIIRACGPRGDEVKMGVTCEYATPRNVAPYTELFGANVRFGSRRNAVSFPRAWLDLPQPHGDAGTCEGLRELAERLLNSVSAQRSFADQLRLMLRRESELSRLDVAELARRVGMSQSVLRRKLAAEGVSPLQLVEEARCRVACRELSRMDRSVKELADALGYAEPSSFHRAFKRWTGKTPADYRDGAVGSH